MLCNAGLGCFLAACGMVPLIKANDAVREGNHLIALYQMLICITNMVMASLVIVRRPAVAKGQSWHSRTVAIIGSCAIVPLGALPLTWAQEWLLAVISAALILAYAWILWALITLRRSFSVFAEARKLITHGPYGIVRHPLYAAYFVTYTCAVLPKLGPVALVLLLIGVSAEVKRSRNEEKILRSVFPDYESYARRVPAFFPAALGGKKLGRAFAPVIRAET
jgi:protein-S-isoprenylcysteine O-methyltransferase Ste14